MTLHKDLAPALAATVIVLAVVAYTSYGLRVYTRLTRRSWGIEDWVMTVGTLPLMALTVCTTIGSYNGIGVLDATLKRPENLKYYESGLFWFFLYEVFYCTSIIPIKLSIAFMLNRIAKGRKAFIYINYCIMTLCASMNMAAALYIIFQCNPVSAAWDSNLDQATHCKPNKYLEDIYYACTSVNIFTDWATALMPIPLLWNVQMNTNTKISVAAILSLGIFASLSGCVRLAFTARLTGTDNYLYGIGNILIWGYPEPAIGMIVGNIATLRPLFQRFLRLGSDNSHASRFAPGGSSGLGKHQHPYKSFDTAHEMGLVKGEAKATAETDIHGTIGKGTASSESDGESQKRILDQPGRRKVAKGGIIVSKQIDIHRS